ncbi:secretory carrier-associated membrane protein 1-like isoform X2 [Amphibalanus amphitrite]|uniref:secretory carrier-associated membrane protein 1-like isoform X2 n=1 Tax=Amphibalanus amphitrite TaxID=1232801 RepID=UPI001C921483|nr:secretory carrier-associated membrane protein 1-like isoform X2 [Amphibalanus amphitrite]XP_043194307.1 secretory carrier-associated membrane protein 1-like isoform X2 [Amphibalanus amphitrite]
MSGFDDNPFADPFADPAVKSATQSNAPGLEEYNPFDGQQTAAAPAAGTGAAPAVMSPTQDTQPPPPYTASSQQQINTEQLQRQQEELERKDEELRRREEALRSGQLNARQNNWPPLPSFVPIGPCFYQDINVDIPLEFQRITRHLYYLWGLHSMVLLVNIIGGMAMMIQFGQFSMFGLALLYFVLFTPASYVCWFRPIYKAFRSDSSFNFMVFFFVFFFQLMVSGVHAIGINNLGACGIINGLSAISAGQTAGNYVVGVLALLIGIGFAFVALCDFILIVKVHKIYRTTGASMSKAQAEFTSGVMRNETVQSATADFAANAVRTQMQQPGGAGDRRF